MKTTYRLAGPVLVMSTVLATPGVFAQTSTGSDSRSQSWLPNGYVGANIGRSDYDLSNCTFGFSCDDRGTGLKLYTGGRFSRYFGLELGYMNLGKADRNGGSVEAQGANISLIGNIPISPAFNLFGKLGGTYGWTKTSTSVIGAPSGKDDGLGLSYGVGMQYDVNRNIAVRADWDRYRLKYISGRDDADLYSVGLVYKF